MASTDATGSRGRRAVQRVTKRDMEKCSVIRNATKHLSVVTIDFPIISLCKLALWLHVCLTTGSNVTEITIVGVCLDESDRETPQG